MTNIIRVQAKVLWTAHQDRQSGAWVGVCDPLGITALGQTAEDLHAAMFEAMDALFRDLLAEGELDQFLRERGWGLADKIPADPDDIRFDIPIEVMMANDPAASGV